VLLAKGPKRIRVLVVDDEPLARSNIIVLLRLDPDLEVSECASGADAVDLIRAKTPDLLFLDVHMPECDGFDVLELLGGNLPTAVVFVTAYDHYALRAFEAGALDYLLKPFDDARLYRALERAKERLAHVGTRPPGQTDRLIVKSAGRVLFIKVSEVDWIAAADYYSCLHVGDKSHLLRRTLSDLEQQLSPHPFCRIHRSAIVNLERVRSLELREDGEYEVVLETGSRLRLSRRFRKNVQDRLGLATRGAVDLG
jgi:two-component system LytT family response regulator